MKLIPLSKKGKHAGKYFAMVDDADYEWLNKYNWTVTIGKHTQYAITDPIIHKKRHRIPMHRLILGMSKGDKRQGDHIDHNGLNNQRSNLRIATISDNHRNSKPSGKSKYHGVTWHANPKPPIKKYTSKGKKIYGGKWVATLYDNNRNKINIGAFVSEEEAARAYDKEAIKHFNPFRKFNFPNEVSIRDTAKAS